MKANRSAWEWARWLKREGIGGLVVVFLFIAHPHGLASGVVTNCTEADVRAALEGGGAVTFACDGTITLTNTLTIATNTVLDASGRLVVLSGGGVLRPFVVNSGVQFMLKNVT